MSDVLYFIIGIAAGVVVGGIIGWLAASRRTGSQSPDHRLEDELRRHLDQMVAETAGLRERLSEATAARATAEANRDAAQTLLAEQRVIHEENVRGAKAAQEQALTHLRETFQALSAETLKQSQPEFLRLANETLAKFQESAKGDLTQRQATIASLVKPLEEQLKIYQQRLGQAESQQASAFGEVKKHLETLAGHSQSLSSETLQLRRVLSSNQARGRWGEATLRRVVESAGLSCHCDFSEQLQSNDSKPDLIVHLPGERMIIVDAKVPDLDFLAGLDVANEPARSEAFASHAQKLRATVRALAERDYPGQFPAALPHVVLFLPAESLFSAALEGDRELIVWAQSKRIILATPSSLIAILVSVSASWQQHSQTENARAIAEAAQELFARITKFTEHFERIRSGLERATNAFNDAVGSYDRMVRPSGEKLLKLGGASGKELARAEPLDLSLRPPPNT